MKVCNICGEEKLEGEYWTRKGKIRPTCKVCEVQRAKQWRHNNPDKAKAMAKKNYEINKEIILERQTKYRQKQGQILKEKNRAWSKKWRQKHPDKRKESVDRFNNKIINPISDAYLKYRLVFSGGYTYEQIEEHPELLDLKKLEILIHRTKKIVKNGNKRSTTNSGNADEANGNNPKMQ